MHTHALVNFTLISTLIFIPLFRSSRPEVFCRKVVLRNFSKITGKDLCQDFFFNKVAALRPATLLKKRLWHRCFPVNYEKFLRTHFLQNTIGGCFLLLIYINYSIVNFTSKTIWGYMLLMISIHLFLSSYWIYLNSHVLFYLEYISYVTDHQNCYDFYYICLNYA